MEDLVVLEEAFLERAFLEEAFLEGAYLVEDSRKVDIQVLDNFALDKQVRLWLQAPKLLCFSVLVLALTNLLD